MNTLRLKRDLKIFSYRKKAANKTSTLDMERTDFTLLREQLVRSLESGF